MSSSVSIRLSPGELAALNALHAQEGGDRVDYIRAGIRMRLDLSEHRKVIHQIVAEELKAALDAQRAEWDTVRAQMLEASAVMDENVRGLMASFLAKIAETAPHGAPASNQPASSSTPTGNEMPRRSR